MRGEMLWFNETKGQGFILTEEGERLAVLDTGFGGAGPPVGRCAHTVVTFDVGEHSGRRWAQNVVLEPDEVPARRARRRRGGMRGPGA
jgi:hypothetical protein